MQSVNTNDYRDLAVEQLRESPTNPRRRFNQETLQQLAASFNTHGVLQPAFTIDRYEGQIPTRREVSFVGQPVRLAY